MVHELIGMRFLLDLGSNFHDNHGGWFNCVFKHICRLRPVGPNLRWVIKNGLINYENKNILKKNVSTYIIEPNLYDLCHKIMLKFSHSIRHMNYKNDLKVVK
jgi:hypothetical protein